MQSFNPYYTGTYTSTYLLFTFCKSIPRFQSLLYWNLHFNGICRTVKDVANLVSILIILELTLQLTALQANCSIPYSFNPYYTGTYTSTTISHYWKKVCIWVSILIILELTLQRRQEIILIQPVRRFNPYYTGTYTSTSLKSLGLFWNNKFQSLLYWNLHFNSLSRF